MKLINLSISTLLLITSAACSKEESPPQPVKAETTGIIQNQTGRIDTAKKALNDSKQVSQNLMDSAAQQRETIEKTQQ
jgi:hypothetical protein